ncbi:HAD-IIA family hydrolase [Paenibacillus sedimenti]|uniref:HAD-IIA family hydrolase n=1 Tax=Paenibacillus sedimenti TaxID=2770274 RepID=A0A926KSD4_9BACL|nr:HAD-IIA family hydrolase [Paenibacillus sedimenti]MBD0382276.1 HAD-IIA family hydrolase [Paenibacillus sedimenti]
MNIRDVEGFVIDLDGTVYKGNQAIDGVVQTIAYVRSIGKRIVFLSNRGNISRAMCHDNLKRMGLDVHEEEIILSSTVAAAYIKRHYEEAEVWVLGDEGLRDELRVTGVRLASNPESADWLLITLHETLTYRDLNEAFRAVRHGARIMATNEDRMFPSENGLSIDVAGMIGAITSATGQEVELVIGKPSAIMAEAALSKLSLPPEQVLMIGDSVESDIRLGKRAGMKTALVLTGAWTREEAEASPVEPDWIWDSLAELQLLMAKQHEEDGTKHDTTVEQNSTKYYGP